MPDLSTLILLAAGLLLLLLVGLRLFSALRGFSAVRRLFGARLERGVGTLRARVAALKVARAERGGSRVTAQSQISGASG